MDLSGCVALVTGGATGLGRAIALELASSKMHVAINYSRSEAEARETVELIKELGQEAFLVQADVSVSDEVTKMIHSVAEHFGRLDAVVANAGTTVFSPFANLDGITEADWEHIMNVNVKGPWLTVKAAVPYLKMKGSGRVVITTSIAGIRPTGSSLAYSVSKAAANHLTRGLAKALGPDILVNAIAPGLLDTRWTKGHSSAAVQGFIDSSPLHRLPTLADCAFALWPQL